MRIWSLILAVCFYLTLAGCGGCNNGRSGVPVPVSAGGVKAVSDIKVPVDLNGLTIDQKNVKKRLEEVNKPGEIKHLYVISPYSGDILIYSTVKGNVTSSGKRLTPYSVKAFSYGEHSVYGDLVPVTIGGKQYYTDEVLQDVGTYGQSGEYLYWWDQSDIYHQHYVTGGQVLHISNSPIAAGKVILNLELMQSQKPKDGNP